MEILDTQNISKYDTLASPQQVLTPQGRNNYFDSLKGENDYFNLFAKLVNVTNGVSPDSGKPIMLSSRLQSENKQEADRLREQILAVERSIEEKLEMIADKTDILEELRAKMHEVLMKIDPKKLAQVKVDKWKGVNYLFESLFHVYYKESSEMFEWSKFKQRDVLKDQLRDFRLRLGNIDLETLTDDDKITLGKMKEDRWFDAILIAKYEGGALQELMNYLGYVNQAIKVQKERENLYKEIDQIRENLANLRAGARDLEKEEENIVQLKEIDCEVSCDDIHEEAEMFNEYGQYKKNIHIMIMKHKQRSPFKSMQKLRK